MSILDLFKLDGKVALVTGASRGIGNAIAQGLFEAGSIVYGIGRSSKENVKDVFFEYFECDVSDSEKIKDLVYFIYNKHGRIDILVNAAGITIPNELDIKSLDSFKKTININLISVFDFSCIVIPYMLRNNHGVIINVTSIGAALGFPGNPAYVASKGGLAAMTRAFARDYGNQGIRINNIVPGYVRTAMTQVSHSDLKLREARAERTMLGRWGEVSDLVGAAVFLASPASSYITGTDIVVDGGWMSKGL